MILFLFSIIMSRIQRYFLCISLILLGGSLLTYAAPPIWGYLPNATLDPDCAPGDSDCFVQVLTDTDDQTLSFSWQILEISEGNNVNLGGLSSPWFASDDNMPATDNTENMYIMGNIGIWKPSPSANRRIDILSETNRAVIHTETLDVTNSTQWYSAVETWTPDSRLWVNSHWANRTLSRFWQVLGGWNELVAVAGTGDPAAHKGLIVGTRSATPLLFGTSDTEQMRISADGKVGIGIQNPASELHIDDSNTLEDIGVTIGRDFDLATLGFANPDTNTYSIKRNNSLRVESEQQRTNIDFWMQAYSELTGNAIVFNAIQKWTAWLSWSWFRARISDGVSKFSDSEGAFLKYANLAHIPSFYSDSVLLRNRVAWAYVNGLSLQANWDIRFIQWNSPADANVSLMIQNKKVWVWVISPNSELDVAGNIKISENNTICDGSHSGEIRFNGTNFLWCNWITWVQLDN